MVTTQVGFIYLFLTKELNKTYYILPPAKEVWGRVMFLHMSIILSTRGDRGVGFPACIIGHMTRDDRGLHPGWRGLASGVNSFSGEGGLHVGEGACIQGEGGSAYRRVGLRKRPVRILLECFLVCTLLFVAS